MADLVDHPVELAGLFAAHSVVRAYRTPAVPREGEPSGSIDDIQTLDAASDARFWLRPLTTYVLAARDAAGAWKYALTRTGLLPAMPVASDVAAPQVAAAVPPTTAPASTLALGLVKLSRSPSDPAEPIVAETTDPRLTDARPPLPHVHQQGDVAGLGTALTGKVDSSDPRLTDARRPTPHTHARADVSGLDAALATKIDDADPRLSDSRPPTSHSHPQGDITGLATALSGKVDTSDARLSDARAPTAHAHAQSDITGLASSLSAKVDTSDARLSDARTPKAHTHPLGELAQSGAADKQVIRWDAATGAYVARLLDESSLAGSIKDGAAGTPSLRTLGGSSGQAAAGNDPRLSDARAPLAHTHPQSDISGLAGALAAKESAANRGAAGGYAPLDAAGLVPTTNLPALGGGAVDVKQTEINFGTTPVAEREFTITDLLVAPGSQILAQIAYAAPADASKTADEATMDTFQLTCQPATGSFVLHAACLTGVVYGKYVVNYLIG